MNDNENPTRGPSGRKPKTFQQWQQVRRKQPHIYYSAATSRKVFEDRATLGHDEFYRRSNEEEL